MGALTSKPFSFTTRPWELQERVTYDYNDTFFSPIRVSFRGNRIMRVLPHLGSEFLFEWIADRSRFGYDSFYGTFNLDYFFSSKLALSANWIFFYVKRINPFFSFFNSSFDLSTSIRLKNLLYFSGSSFHFSTTHDFRNLFYTDFLSVLSVLPSYRFLFFVGLNMRYSFPVLSVFFRKFSSLVLFNIGYFTSNNFKNEINFGFSLNNMFCFFRNSNRLCRFLFSNATQCFFFSTPLFSSFLNHAFGSFITCNQIFSITSKPFFLSLAETNFFIYSSFPGLKLFLVHPFKYISYHLRFSVYQKFPSPFTTHYFGNNSLFFSKTVSDCPFFYVSPFVIDNQSFFIFPHSNFYSYLFSSSFNISSLILLLSAKRQLDNRSNFLYYFL